jgi:hypothetical protein
MRGGDREITVNARNAQVDLADIPFVRLREGLPERLRTQQSGFSQVIASANRGLEPPRLFLDPAERQSWVDDARLDLSNTEFIFMLWLAERVSREEAATDWSTPAMVEEFLGVAARVLNTTGGDYERIEKALTWRKPSAIKTVAIAR